MMLTEQRIFSLLQSVFTDRTPETSFFDGMVAKDWQVLMDLCARQGVLAVCFEAFDKINKQETQKHRSPCQCHLWTH